MQASSCKRVAMTSGLHSFFGRISLRNITAPNARWNSKKLISCHVLLYCLGNTWCLAHRYIDQELKYLKVKDYQKTSQQVGSVDSHKHDFFISIRSKATHQLEVQVPCGMYRLHTSWSQAMSHKFLPKSMVLCRRPLHNRIQHKDIDPIQQVSLARQLLKLSMPPSQHRNERWKLLNAWTKLLQSCKVIYFWPYLNPRVWERWEWIGLCASSYIFSWIEAISTKTAHLSACSWLQCCDIWFFIEVINRTKPCFLIFLARGVCGSMASYTAWTVSLDPEVSSSRMSPPKLLGHTALYPSRWWEWRILNSEGRTVLLTKNCKLLRCGHALGRFETFPKTVDGKSSTMFSRTSPASNRVSTALTSMVKRGSDMIWLRLQHVPAICNHNPNQDNYLLSKLNKHTVSIHTM